MYGRALVANAWLGPHLLAREPSPAASAQRTGEAAQAASFLGGSIVMTGGMGALGTVVAQWLAGLGGCELWLLGRTGRTGGPGWLVVLVYLWIPAASKHHLALNNRDLSPLIGAGGDPLPAALYLSSCAITCSKGDTAANEEAAAVTEAAATVGALPLRGIMHAGAVLDSKVIANISTTSIRAEFAGRRLRRAAVLRWPTKKQA